MSVTRMRSAGFALERSAIPATGSTMTTLPPCSICTLAWPSAVITMSPPGAVTVVVEGVCANASDPVKTMNNATVHWSLMPSSFSPGLSAVCVRRKSARIIRPQLAVCSAQIGVHPRIYGGPMHLGARRAFACVTALTVVCLVTAAGVRAASAPGQAAPTAPPAGERVPMVEEVFKTVVLLRGIPVDTFFEVMGTFASSMGNDCTFCHASNAALDKSAFATLTPRIQKARQMIVMMNAINKQYFSGAPRVTCYTCHGGSNRPKADPSFTVQYGVPMEDPNARDFLTDTRVSANQVFDRYLQTIGGVDRLARLTSYTAKGTYSGFDTNRDKVPVEIYAKAPAQETMLVHLGIGVSTRVFDGQNGWIAGPEQPLSLLPLTGGNLDRARLEALANFPIGLRQAYP